MTADRVAAYYDQSGATEWRRLDEHWLEFHVQLHLLTAHLAPGSRVLDIGSGPGRYTVELARRGHRLVAGDLSPEQVRLAREAVATAGVADAVEAIELLDARDLRRFDDNSFDAVLSMGPFYHLQTPGERQQACAEASRVLRPGGLLFASFLPRPMWLSFALNELLNDAAGKSPPDALERLAAFWDEGVFRRMRLGFLTSAYFARIDEIALLFAAHGVGQVALVAAEGLGSWISNEQWERLRQRGQSAFDRAMALLLAVAEDPSTIGMSSHVLFIGRKAVP